MHPLDDVIGLRRQIAFSCPGFHVVFLLSTDGSLCLRYQIKLHVTRRPMHIRRGDHDLPRGVTRKDGYSVPSRKVST